MRIAWGQLPRGKYLGGGQLSKGQLTYNRLFVYQILNSFVLSLTARKMKLSIKDFFPKCDQIRSFLWIRSHLLKKCLMENFIFCEVTVPYRGFPPLWKQHQSRVINSPQHIASSWRGVKLGSIKWFTDFSKTGIFLR